MNENQILELKILLKDLRTILTRTTARASGDVLIHLRSAVTAVAAAQDALGAEWAKL